MPAAALTFDHTAPEMKGPEYWDALDELASHGPISWVESLGGYWAATSYGAVLAVIQDWESFTSTGGVAIVRPSFDDVPPILPVEVDPPRQRAYRKMVNPHLTIKSLAGLEPAIRGVADELIDAFIDQGSCDLAKDFARKYPGTVFFRLIVACTDEDFRAAEPAARMISFESDRPERFAEGANTLRAWAARVFESRTDVDDLDDIVNAVMHLNDTGESFIDADMHSGLQLLAQGGIGTSASAIGVMMRVLAQDREMQDRVVADRSLIPVLVEECLRIEPPVPLMFRTATRDVEICGKQIRAGDKIGVFFGAANRDPTVFDHPDEVDLDRPHRRHLAFGGGVHRCVGSNLARLQMRIAMEQLIDRLSPFWIPDGAEVEYLSLQARGPASIPLEFSPAT